MSIVSVFVSVILGSLILYANNFLIKKRKKELGIYMTLGMGKRKISRILVTETFIVVAMSLICLMIFTTIVVLSTGISIKKDYEVGLAKETPFDASITVYKNIVRSNI